MATTDSATTPLAEWRSRYGFTLGELADLCGVSRSHLSRIERGERMASAEMKVRIARQLGARVSELFGGAA